MLMIQETPPLAPPQEIPTELATPHKTDLRLRLDPQQSPPIIRTIVVRIGNTRSQITMNDPTFTAFDERKVKEWREKRDFSRQPVVCSPEISLIVVGLPWKFDWCQWNSKAAWGWRVCEINERMAKQTPTNVISFASCVINRRKCCWGWAGLACNRCTYDRSECVVVMEKTEDGFKGRMFPFQD